MFTIRKPAPVKRGFTSHPDFCTLQSGTRPPYTFPFCGEYGWFFVADMEAAGWERIDCANEVILIAPDESNVVPFRRQAVVL